MSNAGGKNSRRVSTSLQPPITFIVVKMQHRCSKPELQHDCTGNRYRKCEGSWRGGRVPNLKQTMTKIENQQVMNTGDMAVNSKTTKKPKEILISLGRM